MRIAVVAASMALAACASSPAPDAPPPRDTLSSGTWTYFFDAGPGIARAELAGADARPQLRITCEAPRGDLKITDWTFSRARQGVTPTTLSVGGQSRALQGVVGGDGAGRVALTWSLSPTDAIFRGLSPSMTLKTAAGGYSHTWAPGAASRLNDVINSCRAL
jgi:hypothetical protein